MYSMFWYANSFNQNIAPWNTDKVIDMRDMFTQASAFNQKMCKWLGNLQFPNNINTGDMFLGSGCDVESDPSISHVCQYCPSLSPSSSNRPTTTPPSKKKKN